MIPLDENKPKTHQKFVFRRLKEAGEECVCVCDAAAAVTSIRKQEAAAMLGNRADFHLGDAVIVAVLSVLLVMLMTDGFFVSIQIYFHSCQRKKKHTEYIITRHKQPESKQPTDMSVKRFCTEDLWLKIMENVFLAESPLQSGSKQTLTWVSENVPSLPVRSYTIMA